MRVFQKWWAKRIMNGGLNITEVMTLFWHSYFASAYSKVFYPQAMYQQNNVFRTLCMGNFKDLLRQVTFGPAMMIWLDISLPKWIHDSTQLLGGMAFPLQLIALGCSLGRLEISSLPRGIGLGVFRLAIGFMIGWGVAEYFELEGLVRAIIILQSSMPVAVSNYLFAVIY